MLRILAALSFLASAIFVSGCGSLDRKIGGPQLSEPAVEFAGQMPAGDSKFSLQNGQNAISTGRWASRVYPFFPVVNWSTFGNFNPEPKLGLRTATIIFPVLFIMRDSVYDGKGKRLDSETVFNFALALGYEDRITPSSGDFRIGLLWIPGIGPFLGAGPEFFQFLWIPFTDFK